MTAGRDIWSDPAASRERLRASAGQLTTPDDYVVTPCETLAAIIARLDTAMQRIPLGSYSDGLDAAYLDVCVAWSLARNALGERPADDRVSLTDAGRFLLTPCPGCVDRCGQCR